MKPIPVSLRVTFIRIGKYDCETSIFYIDDCSCLLGEIDTLNERYQAQAAIDARWTISYNEIVRQLSHSDKQSLDKGKSISLPKYAESHWHPQLFIENALGDFIEKITYSAKKSNDHYVCIREHREIKALLWEKLELYHFPCDVQELSITIGSTFFDDKVILIADSLHPSGINRETFVDQQEWFLYEHVINEQRSVKEFLLDDNGDDSAEQSILQDERKRSFIVFSCHAGNLTYLLSQ